ncbi:MAG: hypothetical protein QXK54_04520 [Ignisphaera sp.]
MFLLKSNEYIESEEEKQVIRLPQSVADIVGALHLVKSVNRGKTIPSNIMLQVLLYGDTFKRIITRIEVKYDEFEKKYSQLFEKLLSKGLVIEPSRKSYYDRFWKDIDEKIDIDKLQKTLDYVLEPLRNNGLSVSFKSGLKFNHKFSEALEAYVFQGRIQGVSFFNKFNKSLTIYSKVRGSQVKQSVSDALIDYYVLLRLEQTDKGIRVIYGCTCPHARGESRDSHNRSIPASYTGACKHVLANLFYFFPNIYSYIVAYRNGLSEKSYSEALNKISEAYDNFRSRLDEITKNYSHDPQLPSEEETFLRDVYSNIVYLFAKPFFFGNTDDVESDKSLFIEVKKIVPSVSHLHEFESLWKSLSTETIEITEEVNRSESETSSNDLSYVLKKIEDIGIYERLYRVKRLLNGLQGSMEDTLYTRSILACLVLGSNLESDPVIVSVYGDPGTGKTLTAIGLGELLGFKSLVIERDISTEDVLNEAKSMVIKRIEKYMEFFENVVLPKVPKERMEEASNFFKNSVEEIVSTIITDDHRNAIDVAKKLAKTFASLYGINTKRVITNLAKLYLSLMKLTRKLYLDYTSDEVVKRRVLDERRTMLINLQKLGLISNADEKEKFNSGAVRWDVYQTSFGYRISIYIDLHYLYSKFGGDKEKILKVIEELSNLGRIKYIQQKGGVAEIKLSESPYLEKFLRTREEDISNRLIWVGGELTRMGVILIDESRRSPELLERMLTDLSKAARDSRRTNVIITTDNAEPLMEAESNPRLDPFHSRVNFEVSTPSATVEATIEESIREINNLDVSSELPLITFDELYLLNILSNFVSIPERFMQITYSIPLLMVYDFKILRPEIVATIDKSNAKDASPLILLIPKGSFETSDIKDDYETPSWGIELPAIRRLSERRFGHHVARAMKSLAIVEKKAVVDEESFITALSMVLPSRIIPIDVQDPYKYFDYKHKVLDTIISKIKEILRVNKTATENLIEVLGSMSSVSPDLLKKALDEMIENPVLIAILCRFLEQMLVSKKSREFIEYSKNIPGLYKTLELLIRYEKLPVKLT